ncbi:uncharacterized protein LOC133285768 [Gastrolobium bilobum]|uniref:uncharacterized protein LOC133285768 n=1 Tax=Gastrolobium bilobum TaxID=150636 RepID=UPI002AB14BA2|nr:uncharacterized protein LOC133285768 [Gastrolobium bilobum]
MSPAELHLWSPINSSSSDAAPHSPLHPTALPHFDADTLNPSFSAGGAAARGRSRPRLVKLRKQSASQHARSRTRTSAGDGGSGFNPFRSDQVSDNISASSGPVGDSSGVESGAGACDGGSSNCHRKFGNEGFVFGARKGDSDSARDLNSQQGTTEKETEFRKSGCVEFVFSSKGNDVESDSLPERGEKRSEDATRTVSGDERKMTLSSETEHGEFNSTGFVFSADGNNSFTNPNTEKGESCVSVGNSGFDFGGERECKTEFDCEKWDCSGSVFGDNHSVKTSSFNVEKQESLINSDCGMGAFNSKTETTSNSDTDADQYDHLRDDHKCKSGYGSTNGFSAACNDIPVNELPDEMKKLNINHSEGAGVTRDSMNSHVNSSAGAVFGGSAKQFHENIGGQNVKARGTNDVQNGTACGIACDSTGIPCSKPSTGQEGIRDFQCGKIPGCNASEDSKLNGATASLSSSSFSLDYLRNCYASTGQPSSADNVKCDNCFSSIPGASKESFMDFKPPTWDPSCFKDNLFPKLNKKIESTQKGRSSKEKGSKYMRRKLKPHCLNQKQTTLDHLSKGNSSLENPDSSGGHSPMDFSPYQETVADDQDVKASDELNYLHSEIPTDYKDEHLAAVRKEDINTTDQSCADPDNDKLLSRNGSSSVGDFHSSVPEIVWPNWKSMLFNSSSISGALADATENFTSNTERQATNIFCFVHGLGDSKGKDFAFSASSTVDGTSSSIKLKHKKKFRRKTGCDSFVISPNVNGKFVSSGQVSPITTANMSSNSDGIDRSQLNDQFKEGDVASSTTIQAVCCKWRLRGNHAHKDGDFFKAEEFYTLGINSVPSSERSECWIIKPLLLCYSNRASTRMSLGRVREALGDCMMAAALDPTFLKVQMRTAKCHLLLGEVEYAQQCFNKLLESGNVVCLDRRVIVEAAECLQKAQEVVKCINNAAELLKERTFDATCAALELLTKALSISVYSEKLLQMKAEALYLLQKYDAAIQLCEQSQHSAEKNFSLENCADNSNIPMCDSYSIVKLWRWSLISKCYFHLGKLEASLNVLEKLQQVVSVDDKCMIDNIEDLLSLAATIRELLDHKSAGNENFKLGKYTEAVENYTVALSTNIKSRPFAAICFCNRAAAHQALGQIADAIADCSMAIALDGNYAKAISRRATLHEMVRDYEQAACDLKRLVSVLETQSNEKAKQSDSPCGSNGVKESRQAHQRLLLVEDEAKKGTPLNFYLILGIKPADTATDIKKAYHKAALRHHPDKAVQLARGEVGDEGRVWKEISQEVHKDADRLFKMIGEAYAVLSDPAKRSEYDLEEEISKAYKQNSRGGTCRRSSDVYGYGRPSDGYKSPSDRTSNRRYGRDYQWKTYGHSYSRW